MADFIINKVRIEGIAAAVPKNEISNQDYSLLSETERKLLIKTTGVKQRRIASPGQTTSDLCYEAAKQLIDTLGWKKEEIQVLIFLSQSRDYYLPATSVILQDRLGLPRHCMSFDIGLGCSGYVYGLSVIGSIMRTAGIRKGLLMVGDISSVTCHAEDKSTYPLFGDAGAVTGLSYDERGEDTEMQFSLNSDGSGFEAIIIPDGGIRNLVSQQSFDVKEVDKGIKRCNLNLSLNGLAVFDFSIEEVPEAVRYFFNRTQTGEEDYDFFVMHQANKLMNETIRKKLKIPAEKVPYSLDEFGNTSSASIPLTIVSRLKDKLGEGRLLIAGFGVGLSWGVASLNVKDTVVLDLIEL